MVTTVQRGHATTLIAVRIGHQCTHRGSPTDRDRLHRVPGRGIIVRDQSHRALARVIIVHHGHRYLAQDLGVTSHHQLRQMLEQAARADRRQSRARGLGVTSQHLFPVQYPAANLRHLLRRAREIKNLQKARILMADQSGTKTSLRVVDKFRQSATFL